MKIVVCVKQVPDTTEIKINPETGTLIRDGVQMCIRDRRGAGMIVNPASIGIIDGIVCPSMAFQNAGGNVALGSDQAPGNNCHNIIHEMKNVCLFNKIKYGNPEVMPAWRALRMATIEGAKAVGVDDIVGSLEPGKQADFIAVDLDTTSMMPVYTYPMRNIVPNLVYSARGREVVLSVVAGKDVYKRQVLVLDGVVPAVKLCESLVDMALKTPKKKLWAYPDAKEISGFYELIKY